MSADLQPRRQNSTTLVDVLDRVLDKGLVVAGDIKVSVAEVELLTIRIRLVVCSIDKAQEIGLDWWRRDPYLSGRLDKLVDDGGTAEGVDNLLEENQRLREELRALREGATSAAPARLQSGSPPSKTPLKRASASSIAKSSTRKGSSAPPKKPSKPPPNKPPKATRKARSHHT